MWLWRKWKGVGKMGKSLWYLIDLEYDSTTKKLSRITSGEVVEDFGSPLWKTASEIEIRQAIERMVSREFEKGAKYQGDR